MRVYPETETRHTLNTTRPRGVVSLILFFSGNRRALTFTVKGTIRYPAPERRALFHRYI